MKYVFLPPYSPDFNPIETAFSAIKQYIRRNGDLYRSSMSGGSASSSDVFYQLHEAVYSVSPENAASWFRHCGYLWSNYLVLGFCVHECVDWISFGRSLLYVLSLCNAISRCTTYKCITVYVCESKLESESQSDWVNKEMSRWASEQINI